MICGNLLNSLIALLAFKTPITVEMETFGGIITTVKSGCFMDDKKKYRALQKDRLHLSKFGSLKQAL